MIRKTLLVLTGLAMAGPALAQSADGYGSLVRVPVAVNTSTFQTEIFIHAGSSPSLVGVTYYGADGTTNPGPRACTTQSLNSNETRRVTLASLCGFSGGSNFGHLRFQEGNPENRPFAVYARVQNPGGEGFSIEGFPIGSITGSQGTSHVTGLRRQASAPGYTSNCFIASMAEAVTVSWSLRDPVGTQIGTSQQTVLAANQMVRIFDVFTAVSAPAGNYSNVRAQFSENGPGEPGYMAFCTVQNNTSLDADFRFAKESFPADDRARKFATSSTTGQGTALSIPNGTTQHEHGIFLQHPDWVQCRLSGSGSADLEMRLSDPDGIVRAGGNDIQSFGEVYLGERSTRNNGVNGMWKLEVENHGASLTFPKAYAITCESGNGSNRPLLIGTAADQF